MYIHTYFTYNRRSYNLQRFTLLPAVEYPLFNHVLNAPQSRPGISQIIGMPDATPSHSWLAISPFRSLGIPLALLNSGGILKVDCEIQGTASYSTGSSHDLQKIVEYQTQLHT